MAKWRPGDPVHEQSYVYFLKCGDFVKIGVSKKPRSRLLTLASSVPYDVELLIMLTGDRALERFLHRQFSNHHHRHEWFHMHDDILEFIDKKRHLCRSWVADKTPSLPSSLQPRTKKFRVNHGTKDGTTGISASAKNAIKRQKIFAEIDLHAAIERITHNP